MERLANLSDSIYFSYPDETATASLPVFTAKADGMVISNAKNVRIAHWINAVIRVCFERRLCTIPFVGCSYDTCIQQQFCVLCFSRMYEVVVTEFDYLDGSTPIVLATGTTRWDAIPELASSRWFVGRLCTSLTFSHFHFASVHPIQSCSLIIQYGSLLRIR